MDLATLVGNALVSPSTAQEINKQLELRGLPTENRIIILTSKELGTTKSGIIIPGSVSEDIPKKAVIVQKGHITEEHLAIDRDMLHIGNIVNFGLYAGKEIEFLEPIDLPNFDNSNFEFRAISVNEIIYVEYSTK